MRFVKKNFIITSIFSLFFIFNTSAKSPEEVIEQYQNVPPTIDYYPYSDFSFDDNRIKWNTSNNLARKTGSAVYAIGDPLVVEGYVFDINHVPIDGVTVRIVQTNSNGEYNHLISKSGGLNDSNFAANGMAVTDNRGYYRFITVFPGYYNRRAPHIHIRLEHPRHGRIETEIFFKGHPRNANDPKYKKLTENQKKLVTGDVVYINGKVPEQGKIIRFNVIYNTNQTTKAL